MSDAALRGDVIAALEASPRITVTRLSDGTIEVAKRGKPVQAYILKPTVSRGLLAHFEREYGVPIAAFYPSLRAKKDTKDAV
jgi:hypothetical protein